MNFFEKIAALSLFCGLAAALAPADKALAVDLFINQAKLIRLSAPAATVFVAEPKVATYQLISQDKVLLFGRGPGRTTFMAFNEDGSTLYSDAVSVGFDIAQMHAALKREFPSLTLKLTPTASGVIVSGEVPSAQMASDVVALLDSFVDVITGKAVASGDGGGEGGESGGSSADDKKPQEMPDEDLSGPGLGVKTQAASKGRVINRLTVTMPNQVVIRVRVAEVSREVSERLGVNWFAFQNGRTVGNNSFLFGLANTAITRSAPYINESGSYTFTNPGIPGDFPDFSALLEALASENLISILAEPNLSVTSGETAHFLAGGEFPFPTPPSGLSVVSGVEFKNYGIMLNVTPTVLSENRLSLRLAPEVSEISYANGIQYANMTVPGLLTRRAETTVELASGQSIAIGGLLQNSVRNDVSKLPLLGDVPVLGALFRSTQFQRGETELVIIATAYIGQPSGNNLRIPNANIIIPNMFSRLFGGLKPTVSSGPLRPDELVYY